jgi:hypothetical protein
MAMESASAAYLCHVVSVEPVIEDGLETKRRKTDSPPWGWLVAGLLTGVGISVLLFRVDPGSVPTETSTPGQGTVLGSEQGIADVVDEFPDGLVATARAGGQSLQILTWPVQSALSSAPLPFGASTPSNPVAFDPSGQAMAALLPVADEPLGVLYAGVPESASIISLDVSGFAWHDSAPLSLAYTTVDDGEILLWVTRDDLVSSELVARAVGIQGHVTGWGDWGFAIQDVEEDSIVLFTGSGEIKDTHSGRVLDSSLDGWLAIDDDGISLLSAGGGVVGIDRPGLTESAAAARFSNDGAFLGLLTGEEIQVVSLDDETELVESGARPGLPQLAWSSDGRFVIYPGVSGVVVVDTADWKVDVVLDTYVITGLGALPSSLP